MGFFMKKCYYCSKEFKNKNGLLTHVVRIHKVDRLEYRVLTEYNSVWPTCKCGCGEKVNWSGELKSFCDYKRGHISRIHNNWGHNKKAIENSTETRRKQFKNGEREVWNKGINGKEYIKHFDKEDGSNSMMDSLKSEERNSKISKKLKGKKKSPEHVKKITKHMKEYWGKQENRNAQRSRRVNWLQTNNIKFNTKLEKTFKKLLEDLNITYDFQYNVSDYLYDFKIKDQKILIEVDGDFYHCNPMEYNKPIYDIQKHTVKHDKKKNQIAEENGYKLLRYWEYDINNHPAKVVKNLLNELKI